MMDFKHGTTLVTGMLIGASICILGLYMIKPSPQDHTVSSKSNFAVVDTYKGCDIVQWSDHQMATYKYFLDCTK